MDLALPAIVAVVSILISPKAASEGAFFKGLSPDGRKPELLTLTFSQVTTWIFARSLMNAAILGFYYGIRGYPGLRRLLSVFSHWRPHHRQPALRTGISDFVIGIRLVSEVFANLLVTGCFLFWVGSRITGSDSNNAVETA